MASSNSTASRKRKRVALSVEAKLSIIDCLSKGESQSQFANEYWVSLSTVGDIRKNAAKIQEFVSTMEGLAMNKRAWKVMRKG